MAVPGSGHFDLRVNMVEKIPGARVGCLVADIDVLVFEEARLGVEFHAELGQGVPALTNS